MPNLANFDIRAEAANGVAVNPAYVLFAMGYGVAYTGLLLLLAAWSFERKDI